MKKKLLPGNGLTTASYAKVQNILERYVLQVYLCIGDDDDVREVVAGEKGLVNSLQSGSTIIDHTTTSGLLTLSREMYETCKKLGIDYIDAPVSGGQVALAEQGALTIMAWR